MPIRAGATISEAPSAVTQSAKDANAPAKTAGDGIGGAYTVLARKYRPQTFNDLIGQEAMVRTLENAFRTGRIAQAYMLTGVRGVGKTTTARILARALNYEAPGVDGPTIDMPTLGEHCAAIMESRHPDVLEIDAASNTGVDNVREIIDAVRYRPIAARYKVYIIDEVHMLSKAAFNALLKTLEEPPEHVKFVFATTEVRKVPVTVLSRCQRFDLRRVDVERLIEHFRKIATAEGVEIDHQAVALIARAAEGSVRDGLSILDQAIAHAEGKVSAPDVRAMLGLAERTRVFDLLETVLKGEAGGALEALSALHGDGAEPVQILTDMADAVHVVTRIKVAGAGAADPTLSEAERARADDLAKRLSMPVLARAWQMLLKGLSETHAAPRPLTAAEMVLVRLAYTADLPTPDDLIRGTASDGQTPAAAPSRPARATPERAPVASVQPRGGARPALADPAETEAEEAESDLETRGSAAPMPQSFEEVVALVESRREIQLSHALLEQVRLVRFRPGHIELKMLETAPKTLPSHLSARLTDWTGARWMVSLAEDEGQPPLGQQRREAAAREREAIKAHPAVQAVLEQFPGAEIVDVRPASPDADQE